MNANISTAQALDVIHDLYMALQGTNGYGGDTAEIYAYRLMPMSPGYTLSGDRGPLMEEQAARLEREAAESLRWICDWFYERNTCLIHIDGLPFGQWMKTVGRFSHRVDVRVIPRDKEE